MNTKKSQTFVSFHVKNEEEMAELNTPNSRKWWMLPNQVIFGVYPCVLWPSKASFHVKIEEELDELNSPNLRKLQRLTWYLMFIHCFLCIEQSFIPCQNWRRNDRTELAEFTKITKANLIFGVYPLFSCAERSEPYLGIEHNLV